MIRTTHLKYDCFSFPFYLSLNKKMRQCFMLLAHTDTLTNRKMTYRLIEMEIENRRFVIWNEISVEINLVT
jgi:hypothetical protein